MADEEDEALPFGDRPDDAWWVNPSDLIFVSLPAIGSNRHRLHSIVAMLVWCHPCSLPSPPGGCECRHARPISPIRNFSKVGPCAFVSWLVRTHYAKNRILIFSVKYWHCQSASDLHTGFDTLKIEVWILAYNYFVDSSGIFMWSDLLR
jgi:hypothetical protein